MLWLYFIKNKRGFLGVFETRIIIKGPTYIPSEYTDTMTLILGKVCSDGVILASDSKATYTDGREPDYDARKVFDLGPVAIAVSGKHMLGQTADMLAGSAQFLVRHKERHAEEVTAQDIAELLYEAALPLLATPETDIGILVADSHTLIGVEVRAGNIESVDSASLGIDDIKMPPLIAGHTTSAFKTYMEEAVAMNEGEHVGGPVKIVIIPIN